MVHQELLHVAGEDTSSWAVDIAGRAGKRVDMHLDALGIHTVEAVVVVVVAPVD